MPPTINDIARACNVSRTTVIRALHNTGRISDKTKQEILKTAKEIGYQPDLLARVLVKGRSLTLGVVVIDLLNQYFPTMIDAMENTARANGYMLNIALHKGDTALEKTIIDTLVGYRVDGIILSSAASDSVFEDYLAQLRVPVLLIGHDLSDSIPCVGIDEYNAAYDATSYIFDHGYRHIVFVAPPLEKGNHIQAYGHEQRYNGMMKAAAKRKVRCDLLTSDDYYLRAGKMLEANKKTAFLCSGDIFAGHIMPILRKQGLHAGKDYGIMGFDCIDTYRQGSPVLASVDNNISEIGRCAAEGIIEMAKTHERIADITIPYSIKPGETL